MIAMSMDNQTTGFKIAEIIADEFALHVNLSSLSRTQIDILHAIKTVALRDWAKKEIARIRQIRANGGHL